MLCCRLRVTESDNALAKEEIVLTIRNTLAILSAQILTTGQCRQYELHAEIMVSKLHKDPNSLIGLYTVFL